MQIDFVNRMADHNAMCDQDVDVRASNGARWDQKPPETILNARSVIQAGQNTAQVTLPRNGVIGFRYQRMNVAPPAWVDVTITNQNGVAQVTNNNNDAHHLRADVDVSSIVGQPDSPLGGSLTITFDGA